MNPTDPTIPATPGSNGGSFTGTDGMTGAPAATTATALAMTGGNDGLAALFSGVLMLLAGIGGLLFARRRTA